MLSLPARSGATRWFVASLLGSFITACAPSAPTITRLDDATTSRIGVMAGSIGETIVGTRFPKAEVQTFDDVMDAVSAMQAGHLDAVVTGFPTAIQVTKKHPDLAMLSEPLSAEPTAVGARPADTVLLAAVNRALDSLRADGTLDAMRARWFKTDLTPYDDPEIPAVTSGVPLMIGVAATRDPVNFLDAAGRVSGHEGELARRIGQLLRRPIEFRDMKFMALIPALQAGKIDLIVTFMSITEERRKRVAFSTSYYENTQRMLVHVPEGAATSEPAAPSWWEGLTASIQSNLIQEQRYLLLLDGLKTTMLIALLSSLFGTLLGALVCYARMSANRLLSLGAIAYIALLRGTPVLVLLMLVFYVVFASVDISPILVAVLAFGMNFAAYVAEIFRTGIEGVDPGQREAGMAMGFTRMATFRYIILPQTIQRVLPVYKGEFISMVKMTSVVGYIAVQDLTKASDIIRSRTFDAFFPLILVALLYFLIAWVLTRALDALERQTDPQQRRRARRST